MKQSVIIIQMFMDYMVDIKKELSGVGEAVITRHFHCRITSSNLVLRANDF